MLPGRPPLYPSEPSADVPPKLRLPHSLHHFLIYFFFKPRFILGLHSLGGPPRSVLSSPSLSLKFMQRSARGGRRSLYRLGWILYKCSSDSPPDWFSCCPLVAPCIIHPTPHPHPHCLSFLLPSVLTPLPPLHTFWLPQHFLLLHSLLLSFFDTLFTRLQQPQPPPHPHPTPSDSILSRFLVTHDERGLTSQHAKLMLVLKYHVSATGKENDL